MNNKSFFLERYQQLGGDIKDIELKKSLRVNTLSISHEKFKQRMQSIGISLTKIPWLHEGYYAQATFSLGAITEYLLGYYYLQEAAAQLPAQILNPQPDELVLDMCAAPGGKTTQLAQHMHNQGIIIALENQPFRTTSLCNNLERMNVKNTIVYQTDASRFRTHRVLFDKILLDAPCSGNYVTDKNWFSKRDLKGIQTRARIQRNLLANALKLLKPNGILIYSTCSLEPEENECNIHWCLEHFNVSLEPIPCTIGDSGLTTVFGQQLNSHIKNCKRFWPHKTKTEGFFISKIRKADNP